MGNKTNKSYSDDESSSNTPRDIEPQLDNQPIKKKGRLPQFTNCTSIAIVMVEKDAKRVLYLNNILRMPKNVAKLDSGFAIRQCIDTYDFVVYILELTERDKTKNPYTSLGNILSKNCKTYLFLLSGNRVPKEYVETYTKIFDEVNTLIVPWLVA